MSQITKIPVEHYRAEASKFADRMVQELIANEHKGIWMEWRPKPEDIFRELDWHIAKLKNEFDPGKEPDKTRVTELCADIANFAMKASEQFGER